MTKRIRDIEPAAAKELLQKYRGAGFHYTEYPHKSFWREDFGEKGYRRALAAVDHKAKDISQLLYVNMPFCSKQCLFCICHTFITQNYDRVRNYLNHLFREMDMLRDCVAASPERFRFEEVHMGGGSPTMLDLQDFDAMAAKVRAVANPSQLRTVSMEIDPRNTTPDKLRHYARQGVTRLSFGIQDFDPDVQKAIHREQPAAMVEELLSPDIRSLFGGINFDLLCGLPRQTRRSLDNTIRTAIRLAPERIMFMYLTYSPQLKRHHTLMSTAEIPDAYERLVLFDDAMQTLQEAGYVRIGMDHFAKGTDSLAVALRERDVHWNSLGYRPGRCRDIIGAGAGTSGLVNPEFYFQNVYDIEDYAAAIAQNKFPIFRGYNLAEDDIMRRDVIHSLRIYFEVSFDAFGRRYQVDFRQRFREELIRLEEMARDGLLEMDSTGIRVTELGTHFVLAACRVFDNCK